MIKYEYTVYSMEYTGRLARLRPTGRIIKRPTQVLFNPDLKYFGLGFTDRHLIHNLTIGEERVDIHGDVWKRLA